ncbi:hypothetical protein BGX27_004028 [Mortierella sp. AM989]|nr:hypothetical protein BGX27_004028 [Mortierella sp. AM989]
MVDVGDDDYEIVEKVTDSLKVNLDLADKNKSKPGSPQVQKTFSLFDTSVDLDKEEPKSEDESGESRYSHLPFATPPKLLQAPHNIPPLYAFNRTTVYLLMGPECSQLKPKSVVLRGTSRHGPLELEIPIQILDTPGEMIHQLAAKKAIAELEQGRGWITEAKDDKGILIKDKHESQFPDMVEREAVRLGVQFQVQGKWSSFVAVENQQGSEKSKEVELLSITNAATSTSTSPAPPAYAAYSIAHHQAPVSQQSFGYSSLSSSSHSPRLAGHVSHSMKSKSARFSLRSLLPNSTPSATNSSSTASVGAHYSPQRAFTPGCVPPPPPPAPGCVPPPPSSPVFMVRSMARQSTPPLPDSFSEQDLYLDVGDEENVGCEKGHSLQNNMEQEMQLRGVIGSAAVASSSIESITERGEKLDSLVTGGDSKAFFSSAKKAKKKSVFGNLFGSLKSKTDTDSSASRNSNHAFEGAAAAKPVMNRSKLEILVDLQTFAGWWEWQQDLFSCIEVVLAQAEKLAVENGWDKTVVATALVIAYFEKKLPKEKDTWELVTDKAKGWLESQVGLDQTVAILEKAADLVV